MACVINIMMLLVLTAHLLEGSHRCFVGEYYRHSGLKELCTGRNLQPVLVTSVELETVSTLTHGLLYLQKNVLVQLSVYKTYAQINIVTEYIYYFI